MNRTLPFWVIIWTITAVLSLPTTALSAKDRMHLEMKGFLVKKVRKEGKTREVLEPLPKKVYPGQVIEYQIRANNTAGEPLKDISVRGRIPEGTEYLPGSATAGAEFSIDGGKQFSPEPVKYKVIEEGKEVIKTAPPSMYTDIRWRLPELGPEDERVFTYRVRVK